MRRWQNRRGILFPAGCTSSNDDDDELDRR
jgi:hypothetical protein